MIHELIGRTPFDTTGNGTSFEIGCYDSTGSYQVMFCIDI